MYEIIKYKNGNFAGVMSGLGKNAGTWDSEHTYFDAIKHLQECQQDAAENEYFRIEKV